MLKAPLPSGKADLKVLLAIRGQGWTLEICGPAPRLSPGREQVHTSIQVSGQVQVHALDEEGKLSPYDAGSRTGPLLFENTNYDLYLEAETAGMGIRSPVDRQVYTSGNGKSMHHRINFGNSVGLARLYVYSPNSQTEICIEIFARKLDYRTDYVALRDEVEAICRWLNYAIAQPTSGWASPQLAKSKTIQEWWSLLAVHFATIVKSVDAIARNPKTRLAREVRNRDMMRARDVAEKVLRRRMRSHSIWAKYQKVRGMSVPSRIPEKVRKTDSGTAENLFVKSQLQLLRRDLVQVIQLAQSSSAEGDRTAGIRFSQEILTNAVRMLHSTTRLLNTTFLAHLEADGYQQTPSMLNGHYLAFSRASQLLRRGLTLRGGPLAISLKNVALLYEQWCFLRIAQLLAEHTRLVGQDFIQLREGRYDVNLASGTASACIFRHSETGNVVRLTYNQMYGNLPTVGQRPDITLEFPGGSTTLFDAKYKLAEDDDYVRTYRNPGPTIEDVNTMHRYRDAIVETDHRSGLTSRVVREAIVLFPWSDGSNYKGHHFYKSITTAGIGGLPFLPGNVDIVACHLLRRLEEEGIIPTAAT